MVHLLASLVMYAITILYSGGAVMLLEAIPRSPRQVGLRLQPVYDSSACDEPREMM